MTNYYVSEQRILNLRQQIFDLQQQLKQELLQLAESRRADKLVRASQKAELQSALNEQKQSRRRQRLAKEFERYTARRIRLEAAEADCVGAIRHCEHILRTADFSTAAPGRKQELTDRIARLTGELANIRSQKSALVNPQDGALP